MKMRAMVDYLRVRTSPKVEPGNVLPVRLMRGQVINAEVVAPEWVWCELLLAPGIRVGTAYVSRAFLEPVDVEPGPRVLLGANTLYTTEAAFAAIKLGARAIVTIDNIIGAREIARAFPDVTVVCRRTWDRSVGMVHPEWLVGELGVRKDDPPLVFVGLNEDDHAKWDVEWIARRAAFDVEMAQRIRAINPAHRYAAYVYPATCKPDEAALADAIARHYAPHYNSGLLLVDNHTYGRDERTLYSVNAQGENERDFYELRWRFLFQCSGFDPKVRGIIATETGVDKGSVGGFRACGFTSVQLRAWWMDFMRLTGEDIVVGGARYPSPVLFVCPFQFYDNVDGVGRGGDKWAGYELGAGYADDMQAIFRAANVDGVNVG